MSSIIRLSPLLQIDRTQRYLSDLRQRMATAEEAAMTGLSVHRPSDAPSAWAEIFALQDSIQDQGVYQKNAEQARSLLEVVDTALDFTGSVIVDALELAVTFSSDILGQSERDAAATRVDGMIDQLINHANTQFAGRYVFAGTAYDSPPFDPATLAYTGSTDVPSTFVAEGVSAQTGFVGSDVFNTALTALTDLADALRTGTSVDVASHLDVLHAAREEVGSVRQKAGYSWMDADDAIVVAERLDELLTGRLTDVVGADPFETLAELAKLQTTFQTALQVTASMGQAGNLFAFLR